jgi:hypothetical protein
MERFLMLVREDLSELKEFSHQRRMEGVYTMQKWLESLIESGNYIGGEALTPTGRYVTEDRIVSDGPFIETKEGISGYMLFQAENIEQAAAIALTCPLVIEKKMALEVRPMLAV